VVACHPCSAHDYLCCSRCCACARSPVLRRVVRDGPGASAESGLPSRVPRDGRTHGLDRVGFLPRSRGDVGAWKSQPISRRGCHMHAVSRLLSWAHCGEVHRLSHRRSIHTRIDDRSEAAPHYLYPTRAGLLDVPYRTSRSLIVSFWATEGRRLNGIVNRLGIHWQADLPNSP
jgi:hypothetical protein